MTFQFGNGHFCNYAISTVTFFFASSTVIFFFAISTVILYFATCTDQHKEIAIGTVNQALTCSGIVNKQFLLLVQPELNRHSILVMACISYAIHLELLFEKENL